MQESNSIVVKVLVYGLGDKTTIGIAQASVSAINFNLDEVGGFLTISVNRWKTKIKY